MRGTAIATSGLVHRHSARTYVHEAILRDGGSVLIRALRPADRAGLAELFSRLSPLSARYRFLSAKTRLSEEELDYLSSADFERHVALVAVSRTGQGGAERIDGVGRFILTDAEGRSPAEFAVEVADREQGRGIGTLLLEHLARLAHDQGIDRFQADVLSDNTAMLKVFEDSGFEVVRSLDGGVVHVVFPTAETQAFLAASVSRERAAAGHSVEPLLRPRSVAVVGASRRTGTIGRAILENLKACGFAGPIYPINPAAGEVSGLGAFARVSDIGHPVDLAIIAVPAAGVEEVVDDCARAGVRAVVVISAGFGEVSPAGKAVERRLRERARAAGMRLVGPNCMGVLNADPAVRLNATFSPVFPPAGNVAMLSQSGALGLAMLDYAEKLNVGLSSFVSVGNKADVSGNDLLSYWVEDDATRVIALYLESFGNPRRFARLAPEVARKKPIVAVKSGRSAAGSRAASSHSAALASLDVGVDALFAQAGVIRTGTLEELFDLVALLSSQPIPRGPRVGVVTNAGGPGILLADACEAHGLALPSLTPATLERLHEVLPAAAGLSNPIDMIASASPAQFEEVIDAVGGDPNIDAVVVIYVPPLVTRPEDVAEAIARGAARVPAERPIATVFMSSRGTPAALSRGPRGAIPSYSFPENAALALAQAVRYGGWRTRPTGAPLSLGLEREREIRALIGRLSAAHPDGGWLAPDELATLLELAGVAMAPLVKTTPEPVAAAAAATQLGFPVVLKASAPTLLHKSDVGGVALGLGSVEEVAAAAQTMLERTGAAGLSLDGFLVQRQVGRGVEAMVGVTVDPSLGPVLVAGLGGVQIELCRDVAFRLTPVTDVEAASMLGELKGRALLDGFRGAAPADKDALVRTILQISALVEVMPELAELDLNPVMVLGPGMGAVAVDGRLRLAAPAKTDEREGGR